MTETATIFKGDTAGPWLVGHLLDDGTLATLGGSYTCTIKVAGTAIERPVSSLTADSKRYIAALTPTETGILAVGQHVVAIELANATLTPPLRTETHIILTVEEQIVGSNYVPAAETDIARLTREITEAKAQRHAAMLGNAVIEVMRDGRKIRKAVTSLKDLNEYICLLEGQLAAAQVAAGEAVTGRRRRPIGLLWA